MPSLIVTPVGRKARQTLLNESGLRSSVRALIRLDPSLRKIVRTYGYPPLWARRPGFQTLTRIILEQQVSLASGEAIYNRVRKALGGVTPGKIKERGTKGLRRLGVTRQKSSYLVALSERILNRSIHLAKVGRMPDDVSRAHLHTVHGIGPWTADVYLLMALRRPDIWPMGDLALHVAMHRFLGLRTRPTSERAARIARRWSPWRSVAARILWHGYLSERRNRPKM